MLLLPSRLGYSEFQCRLKATAASKVLWFQDTAPHVAAPRKKISACLKQDLISRVQLIPANFMSWFGALSLHYLHLISKTVAGYAMTLNAGQILPGRWNPRISSFYFPNSKHISKLFWLFLLGRLTQIFCAKAALVLQAQWRFLHFWWKKEAFQNVCQRIAVYKTSILLFVLGNLASINCKKIVLVLQVSLHYSLGKLKMNNFLWDKAVAKLKVWEI